MNVLRLKSFLDAISFHPGSNKLKNMYLLVARDVVDGKEPFDISIVGLMGDAFQMVMIFQQVRDDFTPC